MSDTIEQIRDAENRAEEIVSCARDEAARIIEGAKKEAERIIADAVKAANDKAANSVSAARETARAYMDKLTVDFAGEIQTLKAAAAERMDEAAGLICEHMV